MNRALAGNDARPTWDVRRGRHGRGTGGVGPRVGPRRPKWDVGGRVFVLPGCGRLLFGVCVPRRIERARYPRPISGGNRPCTTMVPSSSCQYVSARSWCWALARSVSSAHRARRYRRTNFSTCWAVPCRPIWGWSDSFAPRSSPRLPVDEPRDEGVQHEVERDDLGVESGDLREPRHAVVHVGGHQQPHHRGPPDDCRPPADEAAPLEREPGRESEPQPEEPVYQGGEGPERHAVGEREPPPGVEGAELGERRKAGTLRDSRRGSTKYRARSGTRERPPRAGIR